MNIAIIGYGKMGHEIAAVAEERGHEIALVIDKDNAEDLNPENLSKIDVAIEFSSPDSAFDNIITCIKSATPVVSGTTGWLTRWKEASAACNKYGGGLFYASNYSIGVNILFNINQKLASIMRNFPEYEVSMDETHHIQKLDAPSGTAITLAEQIIAEIPRKDSWTLEKNDPSKIRINATRKGDIKGFHQVTYDSEIDTISISHNAKSRKGFATGAVLAAEYMQNKTGIHNMSDMLNF